MRFGKVKSERIQQRPPDSIGRSVATKVRYRYEVFLTRVIDAMNDPLKHQKTILEQLTSTKPNELQEGESIFPNDEIWFWGSAGTAVTIEASGENRTKITNILPIVVGCAEYQFGSSSGRHYTCFNYTVVRLDPSKNVTRGVIHVGEDLPSENVRLDPHNWGGRLAN